MRMAAATTSWLHVQPLLRLLVPLQQPRLPPVLALSGIANPSTPCSPACAHSVAWGARARSATTQCRDVPLLATPINSAFAPRDRSLSQTKPV